MVHGRCLLQWGIAADDGPPSLKICNILLLAIGTELHMALRAQSWCIWIVHARGISRLRVLVTGSGSRDVIADQTAIPLATFPNLAVVFCSLAMIQSGKNGAVNIHSSCNHSLVRQKAKLSTKSKLFRCWEFFPACGFWNCCS